MAVTSVGGKSVGGGSKGGLLIKQALRVPQIPGTSACSGRRQGTTAAAGQPPRRVRYRFNIFVMLLRYYHGAVRRCPGKSDTL